jgi:cell division protein FtsQ
VATTAPRRPAAVLTGPVVSRPVPVVTRPPSGTIPVVEPPRHSLGAWLGFARAPKPAQPLLSPEERRTQELFKARRRAARLAGWKRLGKWVLGLGIPAGLAALVFFSPLFTVHQGNITVEGLGGAAKPAEVSAVLQQTVDQQLVRLDTGAVEQQLADLAGVKSAVVERRWPTGLSVVVTPRYAAAVVQDGSEYVVFDAEAVAVDRVAAAPAGLPVVSMPLEGANHRVLASILGVAASLPPELAARVTQIGAETEDTVTFTLTSGITVLWGDASDAGVKAAAVELLETQPDVTSIDVTAAEYPVVR